MARIVGHSSDSSVVGFFFESKRALGACFRQKTAAATTITPTVNQLTPIQVLRSKWTRKMGLYSAANTPKNQTQSTHFFSYAANAEYAKMGQQIQRNNV